MGKKETQAVIWIWAGVIVVLVCAIGITARSRNMARRQNMANPSAFPNPAAVPTQSSLQPQAGTPAPAGMNSGTLQNTYNQIAGLMNNITVSIYGTLPAQGQPQLLGSGMVIGRQAVLTNRHVVQNNSDLFVTVGGIQTAKYPVGLFRCDPANDLVILQVMNNVDFPTIATVGNSDMVDAGDIVFAAGNAFGNGNLLTPGMIIDNNYSYVVNGQQFNNKFRTNINIFPGLCGGPLVNISGEIVGVNNSMGYTENNFMGIGYATPINRALGLLNSAGPIQGPAGAAGGASPFVPAAYNSGNPYALA